MPQKGKSIEECVKKAKKYIQKKGICLFLFDVKDSRKACNRNELNNLLIKMMEDLNFKFEEYFPENYLATYTRKEKGFEILLGDGSWAGINNAEIIPKIIDYQKIEYPDIPLYWGVAKNGWDTEGTKIVK